MFSSRRAVYVFFDSYYPLPLLILYRLQCKYLRVAGIMGYKAPIIAYAASDSFWRITNINYQNEPAWGYIEVFISRSGNKEPNVLCIGISTTTSNNTSAINAFQVLTGFITTNIVYRDDNYLYLRIPSYCRAIIKGTLIRGSVEATLATDVTEDDLTLVL